MSTRRPERVQPFGLKPAQPGLCGVPGHLQMMGQSRDRRSRFADEFEKDLRIQHICDSSPLSLGHDTTIFPQRNAPQLLNSIT